MIPYHICVILLHHSYMSFQSKVIFKSKEIRANEIGQRLSLTEGFEYDVLKVANDWINQDNTKFEVQTSGSTGVPKKITLTREQIKASVHLTQDYFHLRQGQVAILCLDPKYIAGRMMIIRALEIGLDLICVPPTADPLAQLQFLQHISFAAFVPYQLEAILKSNQSIVQLNKIEKIIIGGAKIHNEIMDAIQSLPSKFYETYGMTETISHVAIKKLNPLESTFKTLSGISISIDERECLVIEAKHLGNQPIVTNDIVELSGSKEFQLIGRADNIINSGGLKIFPEALEEKLKDVKANWSGKRFFIAGIEDGSLGQRVVLVIEIDGLSEEEKSQILTQLKQHLPKWQVPKEIICLKEFERTDNGKVNRKMTMALLH